MHNNKQLRNVTVAMTSVIATVFCIGQVNAQEDSGIQVSDPTAQAAAMEEVIVTGRFLNAQESLVKERLSIPYSADFLGADVIARAADPDVASALRRVPGLTVIDGKFVYVRGLGERYSSVTVNRAAVPSPELTRSVIPLDLFPTSIVESIKVQKAPSPDQPANFGGGVVDIRTTNFPSDLVASVRLGVGSNGESSGEGLEFPGSRTQLPAAISNAINDYQGDISVSNIFNSLRGTDPLATISSAQGIHQTLIDSLNTNVAATRQQLDPDQSIRLALGNSWDLNQDWRVGALFNATSSQRYRNEDQRREGVGDPSRGVGDFNGTFQDIERTTYEERTVGALSVGVDYRGDHVLEFSSYVLATDEAQASISRGFDPNNEFPDQKLNYSARLEDRELTTSQISGQHAFLDTPVLGDLLDRVGLRDIEFDWFFSESKATTDIPNQTDFQGGALLDENTGAELSSQLLATTSSGQFSFLDLEDNQSSWGGDVVLPIELDTAYLTLSGGWWGMKKDRDYRGYNINLNSVGVQSARLSGGPGDVLGSDNLRVENGFDISLGTQFGTESYVGAQKVDAGYGMFDLEFTNWRFTAGGRYEAFQQAVLPIDLLDFSGTSIVNLQNEISDPDQRLAMKEDDIYGSLAVTYSGDGLFGSDQYQVRMSYGESIVRPDLREVADVIYIDPELDVRVRGNPDLTTSPIDNFEIRSEVFYGGGDSFTVSAFFKEIQSPIEQIRSAGSDDDVVLGFTNAESGEIYGLEFEALKTLPGGLFITGNLTLSDSEVVIDPSLSSDLTNLTRRMTGHSEWVVNTTLGYDSPNGLHSVYLNYNAFGERIFYAGTGLNDDAYEQPFDSLGLVYKFFPTDRIEVQITLDNILDESREFTQVSSTGQNVQIITQDVGSSFGVSGRWYF
ncbi:MAG: TonB-dependent receptor domain-containing protein [Candidatus Rariloculaceae bacterium]